MRLLVTSESSSAIIITAADAARNTHTNVRQPSMIVALFVATNT